MSPNPTMVKMNQQALDNLQSVSLTCVTPEREVKWYHQSKILLILDLPGWFLSSFSIINCVVVTQNGLKNLRSYKRMDIWLDNNNQWVFVLRIIWQIMDRICNLWYYEATYRWFNWVYDWFINRSFLMLAGYLLYIKHSTLIVEVPTICCNTSQQWRY